MGWYGWDHMSGWGWLVMTVVVLVLLAMIVAVIVLLARAGREQRYPPPAARAPQDVLAERLARGEITIEEYRQRLAALGAPGHDPTGTR
ncbi:SHOCT domain-containing protein [Blastococcus sp. KM273129]|nr:SHOCT domain-containing protein [Blastococcus sp. KM273129]